MTNENYTKKKKSKLTVEERGETINKIVTSYMRYEYLTNRNESMWHRHGGGGGKQAGKELRARTACFAYRKKKNLLYELPNPFSASPTDRLSHYMCRLTGLTAYRIKYWLR